MNLAITRIRSGGQSGVDRAALDFGRKHNIEICGWCPKGGWAEDYPDAPGVLALYPELKETPEAEPWQRTGAVAADAVEYERCAGNPDDHAGGLRGVQGDTARCAGRY